MPSLARWIGLSLLALSTSLPAQADKNVREIVIHSGWGGLGTPQALTVTILGTPDGFQRDGKPVKPALVQALVSAAEAPPISKPDPANLGITKSWLQSHLALVEDQMPGKMQDATARQKAFFESTFTDPEKISGIVPSLFTYTSFDDYPYAEVKIKFSDGSQLTLTSHSYYELMLPWTIDGSNSQETYNADISRAISALLPPKSTNRERLSDAEFGFHLAEAVMNSIDKQWKEIGAEDRADDSIAKLRSRYTISASDINLITAQSLACHGVVTAHTKQTSTSLCIGPTFRRTWRLRAFSFQRPAESRESMSFSKLDHDMRTSRSLSHG